jgi:hypothetical protein
VQPDDIVGLREPARRDAWPPAPDVPGQEAVPKYFGVELGQESLTPEE